MVKVGTKFHTDGNDWVVESKHETLANEWWCRPVDKSIKIGLWAYHTDSIKARMLPGQVLTAHCSECGSEAISGRAQVSYNSETDAWEPLDSVDDIECGDCGDPCSVVWRNEIGVKVER